MIKDRLGNVIAKDSDQGRSLELLYNTRFGRFLLSKLIKKRVSDMGYSFMSSRLSKPRIKRLINKYSIDMTEYEEEQYSSFNDFFTRRIKDGARVIDKTCDAVIAPADSKLTIYDVSEDSVYRIKGCDYSIKTLLGDEERAKEFYGGKCFVYRLSVDNYHRYCYVDDCVEDGFYKINGVYHTVNPIALEKYDVYGKNCREITCISTENFGRIAYIEVGAMMVGKINNEHKSGSHKKGEEKGYFSFGGSTIIILYRKDAVLPDEDILKNSREEIETVVKYGEKVGVSCKIEE